MTPVAFDRLFADLEPRYAAADAKRKARPGRKRKVGAGRKHPLRRHTLVMKNVAGLHNLMFA